MDRAEGALAVAEKALEEARTAAAAIEILASKANLSFLLNDAGELVVVLPDGSTKAIGRVRGADGASIRNAKVDDDGQLTLELTDGRSLSAGVVRGADGRDGREGEPGRDAAQLEVLPAIDPAKRYARGTWAKHAGGLWLARSNTDGMTGWDCIVNGVAALEIHSDGLRTFEVSALLSDGQRHAAEFEFPTMKYRGVWVAGEYQHGDTVSWDGSMWHCEAATTDKPGGNSPNWKLCVKHGRDGKDGVRGPKGERGAEGRAGRDLTQLGLNGHRT